MDAGGGGDGKRSTNGGGNAQDATGAEERGTRGQWHGQGMRGWGINPAGHLSISASTVCPPHSPFWTVHSCFCPSGRAGEQEGRHAGVLVCRWAGEQEGGRVGQAGGRVGIWWASGQEGKLCSQVCSQAVEWREGGREGGGHLAGKRASGRAVQVAVPVGRHRSVGCLMGWLARWLAASLGPAGFPAQGADWNAGECGAKRAQSPINFNSLFLPKTGTFGYFYNFIHGQNITMMNDGARSMTTSEM